MSALFATEKGRTHTANPSDATQRLTFSLRNASRLYHTMSSSAPTEYEQYAHVQRCIRLNNESLARVLRDKAELEASADHLAQRAADLESKVATAERLPIPFCGRFANLARKSGIFTFGRLSALSQTNVALLVREVVSAPTNAECAHSSVLHFASTLPGYDNDTFKLCVRLVEKVRQLWRKDGGADAAESDVANLCKFDQHNMALIFLIFQALHAFTVVRDYFPSMHAPAVQALLMDILHGLDRTTDPERQVYEAFIRSPATYFTMPVLPPAPSRDNGGEDAPPASHEAPEPDADGIEEPATPPARPRPSKAPGAPVRARPTSKRAGAPLPDATAFAFESTGPSTNGKRMCLDTDSDDERILNELAGRRRH